MSLDSKFVHELLHLFMICDEVPTWGVWRTKMLPGWRYLWYVAYYDVARVEVPVVRGVLRCCPGGGTCGVWRTMILPGCRSPCQ